MTFDERLLVPDEKSFFSTRATLSPRSGRIHRNARSGDAASDHQYIETTLCIVAMNSRRFIPAFRIHHAVRIELALESAKHRQADSPRSAASHGL